MVRLSQELSQEMGMDDLAPLGRECFAITTADLIEAVDDVIRRVRAGERRLRPRERGRLRYHERKWTNLLTDR